MKKFKKIIGTIKDFFDVETRKMTRADFIIILILMIVYSVFAFSNLGDNKAPQTFYHFEKTGYEASFELKEPEEVSKIRFYNGLEVGKYKIYASNDNDTFTEIGEFSGDLTFAWYDQKINQSFKYFKITSEVDNCYLGEIQLYDKYGSKLVVTTTYDESKTLIDEVDMVPGLISHKNSMYFDEIYFARSAYQYTQGIYTNEWVHPPLGKLIQTIPILIFGMTPFAWRLMGCLAGILMIPVMYIFGKTIFKKRKYALLAGAMMMFDNFHFAHTRIGTVDSFLVLFGILSALFMYKYLILSKKINLMPKLRYLALSGVFFGLGVCVKWTGLYLGLALCLMFFAKLIKNIIDEKELSKDNIKIILWCVLFFVLIPVIIYILSYLLFPNVLPYGVNSLSDIFRQIKDMFYYHSHLEETHPFSSDWYSWIVMYKPVWYYVNNYGTDLKSVIVAIGNPAIWWCGILAILYLIIDVFKSKKRELTFILMMILVTWLPYVFIGRCMFMYHFFPTLPFMMLGIVALIKWLTEKTKTNLIYIAYLLLIIVFFIYFYPVVSGKVISASAIETIRWFSNWIF